MKKTSTSIFVLAVCFSLFTSCDKHVTAPAKVAAASTNKTNKTNTTTTTTNTTPQSNTNYNQGHTCGGGNYADHTSGN
jgi:hypothetical protein